MKHFKVLLFFFIVVLCAFSCRYNENYESWTNKEAMLKALEWQELNSKNTEPKTDWTNGTYYIGVSRAHQKTNDDAFLNALIQMGKSNNWKPAGRFYHADDLLICTSYLYLESLNVESVNLKATEEIINDHLYKPHRWKEGNTKTNQPILWWWCDALFMTPPLLTAYAQFKSDSIILDKMHSNFFDTYKLLFDTTELLFARDLRYVCDGEGTHMRDENGEKIFWSRGNGWVLGGLALILEEMPRDYEHRPFYVNLFKTMAKRIAELQPEDGLWKTSLLSPESYIHGETSGSGFYSFAIAWGINNGILEKETYFPVVSKAWNALRACQRDDGMVGWVQDFGDSPKPISSESSHNYGIGAFLLAGSEMIRLLDEG